MGRQGDNLEWKGGELLNVQGPVFVVGLAALGCQMCQCPPFVTCQLMYEEACQGVSDIIWSNSALGVWTLLNDWDFSIPKRSFSSSKLQQVILLMVQKFGLHQLRLVVNPIIYKALYISGGQGFQPATVPLRKKSEMCFLGAPLGFFHPMHDIVSIPT